MEIPISREKILTLVPARNGSKGVPKKNIRLLGGRPLIEYSIAAWRDSGIGGRIVLSTDSEEIATIAKACGAEVPFMRPAELATDDTPMWQVVQHTLECLQPDTFDCLVLLQPTVPFRSPNEIRDAVSLFFARKADTIVSISRVPANFNPYWQYFRDADSRLAPCLQVDSPFTRRQDLPETYHRTGSVYVVRPNLVLEKQTLLGTTIYGLETDTSKQVNIDSLRDWERAVEIFEQFSSDQTR